MTVSLAKPLTSFERELTEYTSEPLTSGFNVWLIDVNRLCERTLGLGIFDLPDMNYRDEYEDYTRASKMLAKIIDYNS